MAADMERTIVTHYNLPTLYPTSWPAELDESEDEEQTNDIGIRRSRSRYSALERSTSDRRSHIPGSQQTGDGRANLVQKDEPDPMGGNGSVVQTLRQRGIPVDQDPRLRNKFMLSSTTFSPALFLSQAHSDATTDELIRGLQYLSRSIDQKSASLKVLVETNFERFVRAKATIDNVYTEMRDQGVTQEAPRPISPQHSRRVSRSSGIHYRNFSSGSASGFAAAPPPPKVSKNALRRETDYGIQGIKVPLLEVSQKAEDVWGPALGGKEREAGLKAIAEAVEKDRNLYELGGILRQTISQRDYEKAIDLYNSARGYANQSRTLGERAMHHGQALTDEQVNKILVTGRMWTDVEDQIKSLKRDVWRRLTNSQSAMPLPGVSQAEEHMELIGILLELGVDDNPIWVWLLSRYDHLKNKIVAVVERSKIEIEILRRRLAAAQRPTAQKAASFLRQASKAGPDSIDTDDVIDFWIALTTYITKLLSLSSGLLGEVVDFWDSAQSFIEGAKQKSLPTGFEGMSRHHHRLSDAGVRDLSEGAVELANMLREALTALFSESPTEDISELISPTPTSAKTPTTPLTGNAFSPTEGRLGKLDPEDMPGPTPKKGDFWEEYAFWPPTSNSLSAAHYLGNILVLLGTAAGEMSALSPVLENNQIHDKLRAMVAGARERCVRAICEAWNQDAENCRALEDWIRAPEKRDQTKAPAYFAEFEKKVITGMQQVLYFSESPSKPGSVKMVTPPSPKLIQTVRTQFVGSIRQAITAMMENAENVALGHDDRWILDKSAASAAASAADDTINADSIDLFNRNVRVLLTLANMRALKYEQLPQLIKLFESAFSVQLSEESNVIRDMINKTDNMLFVSYVQPTIISLKKTIIEGIRSPTWDPKISKPDQASPYVYAAMMTLVVVHTEVSTTLSGAGNSGALLGEILSFLLEKVSQALLDGFRDRKPNTYTLPALMQATLDTEFIAQTMSSYSSKRAQDTQGQIYTELDKRSANEAKGRLQQELGDMRVVLRKLREQSRNSFGCFKRPRPNEKDRGRPGAERKPTG